MRSTTRVLTLSLALACFGAAGASASADDSTVKLISRGARKDALAAMTYKPVDAALWSKLDGWTNGSAPSGTKGKPVLIVAWASWYQTSQTALAEAQKLADKHPDLIVIGAHHQTGFDAAPGIVKTKAVKYAVAKDASGDFFKGLRIDGAPMGYYFIDRAGNLRFPDVDKSSLAAAAKIVSDETADDAAKAEQRSKEAQKSASETPMGGPGVKARATPEDYKKVTWPATNKGDLAAKDFQGKPLPAKLGKEKYLGAAPDRENKIIIIDFWATWCGPCRKAMPKLDELYKKVSKDVVVIGISDEEESTVRGFLRSHKHSYPQAVDSAGTVSRAMGIQGIPHVVVLSTDGVVRWQGNPLDIETLTSTVNKLVEIDPGVKARQAGDKK